MKTIDNIFLPKSSKNEELERISLKKFAPLFDEKRFILKGEVIDNGIDTRNEIILNDNKLGFGFNFQLKATDTITPNADGSYSKSIYTSNIEYLLNNGQPAFYGFYVKSTEEFYYTYLNDAIISLSAKDSNWEDQPTHVLRFELKLDNEAVDKIYSITLKEGIKKRAIIAKSIELGTLLTSNEDKIIVDPITSDVYDDAEIRNYVERYGTILLNTAAWNEILKLHNKASRAVESTSKYCLLVGIAAVLTIGQMSLTQYRSMS